MKGDGRQEFVAQTHVSRETLERFDIYASLLARWTPRINLVSPRTLDDLWHRHFLDSAQLVDYAPQAGRWVDLGSGAGFPGMVMAILLREKSDADMVLVESDQRKAAFLRTVAREVAIGVEILASRIEEHSPLDADVLTSRALAPLDTLLGYAARHMKQGGTAIFPKGATAEAEIADALERWRFRCEKHASRTDTHSTILCIGDIKRV